MAFIEGIVCEACEKGGLLAQEHVLEYYAFKGTPPCNTSEVARGWDYVLFKQ